MNRVEIGLPHVFVLVAKEILYLRARLNELLSRHTGQPVDRIERDTDRDFFFSGDEAVGYGLVDKVLASRAE